MIIILSSFQRSFCLIFIIYGDHYRTLWWSPQETLLAFGQWVMTSLLLSVTKNTFCRTPFKECISQSPFGILRSPGSSTWIDKRCESHLWSSFGSLWILSSRDRSCRVQLLNWQMNCRGMFWTAIVCNGKLVIEFYFQSTKLFNEESSFAFSSPSCWQLKFD